VYVDFLLDLSIMFLIEAIPLCYTIW